MAKTTNLFNQEYILKKLFRHISIIIALALIVTLFTPATALATGGMASRTLSDIRSLDNWPSAPGVSSRSAYVIELNSGEVLFAQNEDEQRYPASITKVMTALLVCENCSMDEQVTFSHEAVTDLEVGGFNGNFYEGEVLTVEQCLYALLLNSVNECAYALAEHVAGSVAAFADMMNARAAELGCTNTHFVNPHGLNDPDHLTTAHDMALIYWACIQNEQFYEIDSALTYQIPKTETSTQFTCQMHHKMMVEGSGYYCSDVKAGKTGYTSLAFHTLVTYAERDGKEVIVVCMKESTGGGVIYQDTQALLNYAFNNFELVDLSQDAQSLIYGVTAAAPIPVKASSALKVFLPNGSDAASVTFSSGAFQIKSGENIIMTSPVTADASAMTLQKSVLGHAVETNEAADDETPTQTETADTETGETTESVLLIILIIILGLLGLVIIYFIVIQLFRYKKQKERRERIAKQMRKARLERIRRETQSDDSSSDIGVRGDDDI